MVQQMKLLKQNKCLLVFCTKLSLLSCLPSCGGGQEHFSLDKVPKSEPAKEQPIPVQHQEQKIQEQKIQAVEIYEAKWADMPFLVDAAYDTHLTQISNDQTGYLFVYTSNLSYQAIVEFYQHSMEWHGWRKSADFAYPSQTALFYEKPLKTAVIFIDNDEAKRKIKICVGLKKNQDIEAML
jgi:hypothetical protein